MRTIEKHSLRLGRRGFLQNGTLFLAAAATVDASSLFADDNKQRLRVGLITDLHHADKPSAGTRHYRETLGKLEEAAIQFEKDEVNFVVELGDLIDAADCGIIRTIGCVNFLDDHSQTPHMKLPTIDKVFGVGENTGQSKSKLIRTMLKIRQFDHQWTLPSKMDDNHTMWMLGINGFIVDVRRCTREVQEAAFEKGLIPYIPADRSAHGGTEMIMAKKKQKQRVRCKAAGESHGWNNGIRTSWMQKSKPNLNLGQTTWGRSGSDMFKEKSTTAQAFVTANLVWSSHGTATMSAVPLKGEAGPYLTGTKSRG